ncbi:uncharacterized protein LOC132721015 [Ruditapes philippinarum]|uniref:uncharacterized protein LOC132721015 n=1 Tax=Ruditapes philippinarum TaxID=129788 RepID=UPI00295BA3EC|nr:uncharacterized protein LOC132721015 [Ruditapes philippinarum]
MATNKKETSTGQSQADYEQAKLERQKKLIEQYHKTLLQISTTPLQPKSEKCTFNDIYIRPKITREIKEEKGETEEVEVKTMSEIFTKDGVSQKSIYVLGDAGSGKTSFCKYLVNCWCFAHSEEHEADNEKHGGVNEIEGDSEKRGRDNDEDENHGGSFCKYLANCWCFAHSEEHEADNGNEDGSSKPEGDIQDNSDGLIHSESHNDDSGGILTDFEFDINYELKFNGVKEMKKFDIVFYIPLRQYQNIDTIDEMLQKRYQMKIVNTLPEEESSRVMILLDGLDEWSSENIPEHCIFKEYTIVTTSRPWKFHTLRLSDVEIEQSLNLKGFDLICEREMVNRTVSQLNVRRHANKRARDCMEKLKEESLESLKQVPIMLQHLICLWFDGKLDKTSRCTIYT